ncbi:hypothetical protein, partial [Hufsiella ginkgonis]
RIAEELTISVSSVYNLYAGGEISIHKLWQLGQLLQYDFVQLYLESKVETKVPEIVLVQEKQSEEQSEEYIRLMIKLRVTMAHLDNFHLFLHHVSAIGKTMGVTLV